MFNVGGPEVLVILLVALIVLGPAQLPKAARQVGNVMNEIRKISSGFQQELTSAFEAEETEVKPQSPGGPHELSPDPADPAEPAGATGKTGETPEPAPPSQEARPDGPSPESN